MRLLSIDLNTAGITNPARPPKELFGIVWSILFVLLGVAWSLNVSFYSSAPVNAENATMVYDLSMSPGDAQIMSHVFYSTLVFLLFIWPFVWTSSHSWALADLMASMVLTLLCMTVSPRIATVCLIPLHVWLLYAMMLNYTEIAPMNSLNTVHPKS
jgi:tryptophan-rich sensory protein